MDKRIGIIGIFIMDIQNIDRINVLLHEYAHLFVGRMGIPYRERHISVISLIVDGTNDEISALTGKIGRIQGVSVKTMLSK